MGGDTPLDIKHDLLLKVMKRKYHEKTATYDFSHVDIEKYIDDLVSHISNIKYREDRNIAWQVLGVLIMETGASVSDDVISSIVSAAENDEWAATGDDERIEVIEEFISLIKSHKPGSITLIQQESLLDKMV